MRTFPLSLHDAIGVAVFVALLALLAWTAGPAPEPLLPEVVLDTLYAPEPHCRHAGQYGLGNHQKDSVAVLLVCKRKPLYPRTETDG